MSEQKNEQKIEQFWRDATAADVARVMKGEKVEARFRDSVIHLWLERLALTGVNISLDGKPRWIASKEKSWVFCQVYDPPQWWLDRPDPGEGWRLLEKFPDEMKGLDDEEWDVSERLWKWNPLIASLYDQHQTLWYRRRIEPNSPEKLDSSVCASSIPKGWTALSLDEPRLASDAYWSIGAKDWVIIDDRRVKYANRDKWPAIRQVETHKSMQLVLWHQYRLPNGRSIKVTKEGFDLL